MTERLQSFRLTLPAFLLVFASTTAVLAAAPVNRSLLGGVAIHGYDVMKTWSADIPGNIKKADANWPGIAGGT